MNRLPLLIASSLMALALVGCGDNAEKKVETNAAGTAVEQTEQPQSKTDETVNTDETSQNDAAAPAQSSSAAAPSSVDDLANAAPEADNSRAAADAAPVNADEAV